MEERLESFDLVTCVNVSCGEEAESVAEQWKECNRPSLDLIRLAHKHLIW